MIAKLFNRRTFLLNFTLQVKINISLEQHYFTMPVVEKALPVVRWDTICATVCLVCQIMCLNLSVWHETSQVPSWSWQQKAKGSGTATSWCALRTHFSSCGTKFVQQLIFIRTTILNCTCHVLTQIKNILSIVFYTRDPIKRVMQILNLVI